MTRIVLQKNKAPFFIKMKDGAFCFTGLDLENLELKKNLSALFLSDTNSQTEKH